MKTIILPLLFAGFCNTSSAQALKTSEHPFFKEMLGECVENGKLLLPGAKEAVPMKVTMKLKPALDGVWVQEDGKAESAQISFSFRWMFRVVAQEDRQVVIGRFIDSNGQIQDYSGGFKDAKTLVLRRNTKDGKYTTTVTRIGDGKWSITARIQPTGSEKTITIYQAEKSKA